MGQARPTVVLDIVGDDRLAGDLAAGGVFVPGCAVAINEDCELVLRGGDDEVRVAARVVFANAHGAGLQLADRDVEMKRRIAALAGTPAVDAALAPAPATADTDGEADDEASDAAARAKLPLNAHERLRNLSVAEQLKVARRGDVSERIVLERLYGKTVWEAVLRNPRVTGPEVARIARMGALPRVLIETIVSNGAWLQIPEVRRALLTNPRLGTDQILRILRLIPKHELKLASIQTAYPFAVRDAARRMLRETDHGK